MIKKVVFILLIIGCNIYTLIAGTTGKIAGLVKDVETGDPLTGVNVFLQGTTMGAATDLDGFYAILNVPPGKYTLTVSYVGYAEYQVRDVVVKIDLTTRIDIELKSQLLETDVVVIQAERPIVTRDISNSQMNIEAEVIEALPVRTVNEVLTLQAGIEMGREGILVRHGSADQTIFMVDGMSMNDERGRIPYTTLSLSSIQEINIQTGGFTADYGDARSGLVNVVTKEGDRDKYTITAILNYRPAARKHFGPSIYREDSYFNRPFMDPAVCWTGTDNGAWDDNTRKQYPNFEGWNAVSERTLSDNDPANDLTPVGAKRLFEWQRRRAGDITKPDYVIDIGLGGPFPFIAKDLGDLRFFLSHFRRQDMFIYPLSNDGYEENFTRLKLTSDITPSMKLLITGTYAKESSVTPYQWTTTPTGRILKSQSEIANLLNSSSGASVLYMPGYYSPADKYHKYFGLNFTHAISQNLFYDLRLQYQVHKNNAYQTKGRDLSLQYEPVSGYFVDEAPYGYYGYSVSAIDGTSMGGWMNLGRDRTVNSTYSLFFDLTSQLNPKNQLKTGFSLIYDDFDIESTTESPSMGTWTRSQIYQVYPFRMGLYIYDKLEFEDFIANAGLRLDYSSSNTVNYLLDPYDPYYKAGYGNSIEEEAPTEKSKPDWSISPRLGVSHPITENSKLYFNYTHLRSEPTSSNRFRLQRESNGLVTSIGNPNLLLEKTISYELGYEHNLFNQYLIKVAAYYKDVTSQPGWVYYENINTTVQYSKTDNNNYEDIRGFEVTLTKRVGPWFRGFINYTYDVITEGYFGLLRYYEDPNKQREYERLNPQITRPHPRPYARLSLNFNTPYEYGPDWGGIKPLADWNLNILSDWKSGSYYLYRTSEEVEYEIQWKDWFNTDIRIGKLFKLGNLVNLQLYVDITNIFNFKYLNWAGFSDNYDRDSYLESLNFSWEKGDQKGDDNIGDYRPVGVEFDPLEPNPDNDPEITARNNTRKESKSYIDMPNIQSFTFLNPRDIVFGIRINF
jgi:outer membrane receptor protein involved in Fe transport